MSRRREKLFERRARQGDANHEESKKLHADEVVSRMVGALEFTLRDVFGEYLETRGADRVERDFSTLEKLLREQKNIVFTPNTSRSWSIPDEVESIINDINNEEVASLFSESSLSKKAHAILEQDLPQPDLSVLSKEFLEKFDLENNESLMTAWLRLVNLVSALGKTDVEISSVESAARVAFSNALDSAKGESEHYRHLGESQYDDHVGVWETDMDEYKSLISQYSKKFKKLHSRVIRRFKLNKILDVVEEEARRYYPESKYVNATVVVRNPNIPRH